MQKIITSVGVDTSVYVEDFATGEIFDYKSQEVMASASLRKVSILMSMLHLISKGIYDLTQPFEIEKEYQDNDSGVFQFLKPGFRIILQDALMMMIVISDNTCTGKIWDMIGAEMLNGYCMHIGLLQTVHAASRSSEENKTSAFEVSYLLKKILLGCTNENEARNLGVTKELCQIALSILKNQQLTNGLRDLLPRSANVASKTGMIDGYFHEAGIVFSKTFTPLGVLCVMTKNVPQTINGVPDHTAIRKLISRLTFEGLEKYVDQL